jgi:hypothetical protein
MPQSEPLRRSLSNERRLAHTVIAEDLRLVRSAANGSPMKPSFRRRDATPITIRRRPTAFTPGTTAERNMTMDQRTASGATKVPVRPTAFGTDIERKNVARPVLWAAAAIKSVRTFSTM